MGRTTAVWLASRATSIAANYLYSYTVSNSGLSFTTKQTLNDESGYEVSTLIYDALLRPRQTQSMTPKGGRMVTDTFYDTHGWKMNGQTQLELVGTACTNWRKPASDDIDFQVPCSTIIFE